MRERIARLLTSPDVPPLPWSSMADREPWPDGAADHHQIVDANGQRIFGGRNWREACAAIELLVAAVNALAAADYDASAKDPE
jgi:hypothetical protein